MVGFLKPGQNLQDVAYLSLSWTSLVFKHDGFSNSKSTLGVRNVLF